jgi:hypothetical protein
MSQFLEWGTGARRRSMRIEEISIQPDQPKLGETLQVTVRLHNDSQEKATAMLNAVFRSSQDPSSPTAVQQASVRNLKAGGSKEVLLFKMAISERFQPGPYTVEVWLAGQRDQATQEAFEIAETKDFLKSF